MKHFKSIAPDVVADPYTVRDARLHLRHVRDLLRSLDPADAYNGVNCSSLSYLTFYTRGNNGNLLSVYLLTHQAFCQIISPPCSSLQTATAWGTGELLWTAALQNTSCLDVKSDRSLHCSPSETTGRSERRFCN